MVTKDFKKLRRACYQEISAPTSTLPKSLLHELKPTKSLDDMLDVLALSPYSNWVDTRLLQALVSASGSSEAEAMLEQFKQIYHARKVSEVLPCVIVRPFKDSVVFIEKFNKDPSELTLLELLKHKHKLEYDMMNLDEDKIVLSCIRAGCVEMIWLIPLDLVYQAYNSVKKNVDKFSSLAIESLVCKAADEYAGLPILWRGQEVEEIGPIEPVPEHVRQEPYSLPQGFHWVTLGSSDVEEVVKFVSKYSGALEFGSSTVDFITSHPNTKDEWQFGVRTTNGKLVAVVLAYSACISIGGVSIMCIKENLTYHPKYQYNKIWRVLIKELMRRVNLYDINHLNLILDYSLLKPITTLHTWKYIFGHPTNTQLPKSPRTPGWRRMTSEDVPSALALINKWSSQFEIRQVFNSEEEVAHEFLCPFVPKYVFTYVVENEANNITDLVGFKLMNKTDMQFGITTVASTQSPLKQLIIDALVCARQLGAKELSINGWNIKHDVLSSLSFQCENSFLCFSIYNYKYYEISETKVWYL